MEIEIKVKGISLPLLPGYTITREAVSTIFNASDDVYDFTYPMDIPLTNEARMALGFPDIISNVSLLQEFEGELILNTLYTYSVTVKILSVNTTARTCRISLLGQYRNLPKHFGNAKVNMLEMGGFRLLTSDDPAFSYVVEYNLGDVVDGAYNYGPLKIKYYGGPVTGFMTAISKGLIEDDFLFPKAIELGAIPGLADGVAVINAWDPARDCHVEADLLNALYIEHPMKSSDNPYAIEERHFIVPMLKLYKVIIACFEEHGLTVSGDILTDSEFQKIVLYNTHALNIGVSGFYEDGFPGGGPKYYQMSAGIQQVSYLPADHLPDMGIAEFINELGRRYGLQYSYDIGNKHVRITTRNSLANNPNNILDLTNVANTDPAVTWEKSDVIKGYRFSFDADPADAATYEDVQEDVDDYPLVHIQDYIGIFTPGYTPKDKDMAYVRTEDCYYQYSKSHGDWFFYSRNICPHKTTNEDGLAEVKTKIISQPIQIPPPLQRLTFLSSFGHAPGIPIVGSVSDDSQAVPYSKIGITARLYSYYDFKNENGGDWYAPGVWHPYKPHLFRMKELPVKIMPHVITVFGFEYGSDSCRYVFGTSGPYSPTGATREGKYHGCWLSPEGFGLIKKSWAGLTSLVQDSVAVEYEVLLTPLTYAALDPNNTKIIIAGVHYLVKKIEATFPLPAVSKLTLIRI